MHLKPKPLSFLGKTELSSHVADGYKLVASKSIITISRSNLLEFSRIDNFPNLL